MKKITRILSLAAATTALVMATSCGDSQQKQDSIDSAQGNAEVSLIEEGTEEEVVEEAPAEVMAAVKTADQKLTDGQKWTEEDLDGALTYLNLMLADSNIEGADPNEVKERYKYSANLQKGVESYDLESVTNPDTKAKVEEYKENK